MINTKIQLWITKIIWSIRHKFQRSITCITFESLKLRPWSISQGGQMSDDDDISSFLSRPRPALSDICVQFITPGNAPGPNSGPVGTFQWMRTVWKPDARWRSEYSDKRRRTVNDVDGAVVFIARTMPCHRTRASFTHLSEIQIHETNTKYKFERRNCLPILKLITKWRKQHVEHYVSMEYTMYQNTKGLI